LRSRTAPVLNPGRNRSPEFGLDVAGCESGRRGVGAAADGERHHSHPGPSSADPVGLAAETLRRLSPPTRLRGSL